MQTDLFGDTSAPDTSAQAVEPAEAAICLPASPPPLLASAADQLPDHVYLGTSSWAFPGWKGLIYDNTYTNKALAHDGLYAYAASPLLRTVGIDRSFYAPVTLAEYQRYAAQVPDAFRFVVKAPSRVCDASIRDRTGSRARANPDFLNADIAVDEFLRPCLTGLGVKAGVLIFQLSPLDAVSLADPAAFIARLAAFFETLKRAAAAIENQSPRAHPVLFALEIRDASLLTPRLIRMLRDTGVRYCLGIHSRMPDAERQAAALAMLDSDQPGPLVVRWSLHAGMRYDGAKARYEPFDAIVDPDPKTRHALAALVAQAIRAGQPSFIIANNKAEGSSPLSCAWLALAIADALRANA